MAALFLIIGPLTENDVTSELNTVLRNISHCADENIQRVSCMEDSCSLFFFAFLFWIIICPFIHGILQNFV